MTYDQLDINLLENYLTNIGKEVLEKMLALYCQQAEIYLADIEKALNAQDQEQWQEHCHKMKGASGSAGLLQVHALLVTIEKSTDEQDLKRQKLQELQNLNKKAIAMYEQWLLDNS